MTNETILIIVVAVAIAGLVIDMMLFIYKLVFAISYSIQKTYFNVNIFWNLFFAGIFTFIIAYYFLM